MRLLVVGIAVLAGLLLWAALAGGTQPYDTYEEAITKDGPVAQYRLNDASGSSTLADSAGSYAATNSGVSLGGEGPFPGSKSGDWYSSEAYASLPSNPLASATAFTAEAWVNWGGGASYQQSIFNFGSSTSNYMILTPSSSATGHKLLLELHTSAGQVAAVSATKLGANSWEYVAVTETSSGTLTLYVNGEQIAQTTGATITPSSLGTTANDFLGKGQGSEPHFKGLLSNVAFYNKALTGTQILTHYHDAEFPVNSGLPTISGTAKDGKQLTAKAGTWSGLTPFEYAYQWLRCNSAGSACESFDASGEKYTLGHADVGHTIRVTVTAENAAGKGVGATSAQTSIVEAIKPSELTAPMLSGTAEVGQEMSVSTGNWEGSPPTSYAYQWESCNSAGGSCKNITSGGTNEHYEIPSSLLGKTLRATVTAINSAGNGNATSAVTAVVAAGPPRNKTLPAVTGSLLEGETLTATSGSWAGTEPITFPGYEWQRCNSAGQVCTKIASGSTYRATSSDVGSTLRIKVIAKNSVAEVSATSAASAIVAGPPSVVEPPEITGPPEEDQTLSASTGSWNGYPPPAYAYQWESCNGEDDTCIPIEGATLATFTPTNAEVGKPLRVTVTARNGAGKASSASAPTSVIRAFAPSNVTSPTISGEAQEGQTLVASSGSWTGAVPIEYSYQWESCGPNGQECEGVEGATGASYELGAGDVGNTMRVIVTASNEAGAVSVTSGPTAAIGTSATLPVALERPEISGLMQQGQTVRANVGVWTGTRALSYRYQWERCSSSGEGCNNISGASQPVYKLGAGDVGDTLRVTVTATNALGQAASVSPPGSVVQAPASSAGPACTDTWTGESGESWETPWDWSTGFMPGASDVACIGPEAVEIGEGSSAHAGVLRDEGELVIWNGSLELSDASDASEVASLSMVNSTATLMGAASLQVLDGLEWDAGTMSGTGETIIGPSAIASVGRTVTLTNRAVINEGTVTLGRNALLNMEGGLIDNVGTLDANSEACCTSQVRSVEQGGDGEPRILNTGVVQKTEGSGTTSVGVGFTNDGVTRALTGTLRFLEGGVGQEASTGTWSTSNGANVALVSGVFNFGEAVNLASVTVGQGAVVTRVPAPSNSSAPSIAGAAAEGQTLTASDGAWSGANPTAFSYQWERCVGGDENCSRIPGATNPTYEIGPADGTASLRVQVTATNPDGAALAVSEATEVVPATSPHNTGSPSITGIAEDGRSLSVNPGSWTGSSPVAYSYQWERCSSGGGDCEPVEEANQANYVLTERDIGSTVRVAVTASNPGGVVETVAAPTAVIQGEPPTEIEAPSISGTLETRHVLYASSGVWKGTDTELSYQWESCSETGQDCAAIEGATGTEYDLSEGDAGTTLRVRVGDHGERDSVSDVSRATAVVADTTAPLSEDAPSISGAAQVGQALSAARGSWSSGVGASTYAYQWQVCGIAGTGCEAIDGATASEFVPSASYVGSRLRVAVTARDEAGHVSSASSDLTQPVADSQAPVPEQAPLVSGPTLRGQTLSAGEGVFAGEGMSYSFQWERCSAIEVCTAIEGATQSSYTLTDSDVGSTVRLLVAASDTGGSSTAVSAPTASVEPEAVTNLAAPTIAGVVQQGGSLTAHPGIWTGVGAVSYGYAWERCNAAGEDCSGVAGATEATYGIGSSDLGSTFRVQVTATSPLGSASATSRPTEVAGSGEVSVEDAEGVAHQLDPGLLEASTTASLEGQTISPTVTDTGEELAAQQVLTSSTISKETAGEFAVNTPVGELSLAPVEGNASATTPPTIVNGSAALIANSWPATDTIIRPEPLGATTALQIRSPEAPRSFSWQLRLAPDQELKQLADGSVAVVRASDQQSEPSTDHSGSESGPLREASEAPPESAEERTEAEREEAQPEPEENEEGAEEGEVPLEPLLPAPHAQLSPGEARSGQPQPQETQQSFEAERSAMSASEAQTDDETLMVIAPPAVTDAGGHEVPASITTMGNTVTVSIGPSQQTAFPLLATLAIAASSDQQSAGRDSVRYGLSDPEPERPGHIDEHFSETGAPTAGFDPNLEGAPLHVSTARLIVPYDVLRPNPGATLRREKSRLETWLHKIGKTPLQPYITLEKDPERDPCGEGGKPMCAKVSLASYRKYVAQLMSDLIPGSKANRWPRVEQWGAWNEPDNRTNPLRGKLATRAAQLWEIAQADMSGVTREHHCAHCSVTAGEFAYSVGYNSRYTSVYRDTLLCKEHGAKHCLPSWWHGLPAIWGFHEYHDVDERKSSAAHEISQATRGRVGSPQLYVTEGGVLLDDGGQDITVNTTEGRVPIAERRELQAEAAEEFRNLHVDLPRIDREYYYQYAEPSTMPDTFDSGLLVEQPNGLKPPVERPAYCVLAYVSHVCLPTVTTESSSRVASTNVCSELPASVTIKGHIEPNGGKTASYYFEWGATTAYNHRSPRVQKLPSSAAWNEAEVEESVPAAREQLAEGQGCADVVHFRLVVTNAHGTRASADATVEVRTINA